MKTWCMCQGDESRTYFNPQIRGTLAQILFKLSNGASVKNERKNNLIVTPFVTGYEMHLAALHINLRAEARGHITTWEKYLLEFYSNKEPNNAFYAVLHAKWNKTSKDNVLRLLNDRTHFPIKSLPTNLNHCHPWLFMTEFNKKDWEPCENEREYYGADWLFVANIYKQL